MIQIKRVSHIGKSRFLAQLVLSFFAFFIIIQLLSAAAYSQLRTSFEKSLVAQQAEVSYVISSMMDEMFDEVFQANYLVGLDKSVQTVFSSHSTISGPDYYIYPQVMRTLSSVTAYSDIIEGIAIYRRNDGLVVSDKAVYKDTEYFNSYHRYADYDEAYWKALPSFSSSFVLMKPTNTFSYMDHSSILLIPTLHPSVSGIRSSNLFIVDLNYHEIQKMLDHYLTTANSSIYIINGKTDEILFTSSNAPELSLEQLKPQNEDFEKRSFQTEINRNDYVVVEVCERISLQPVRVLTLIPTADIAATVQENSTFRMSVYILLDIVVASFLALTLAGRAYSPLKQLMVKTSAEQLASDKNEFDALQRIYSNAEQTVSTAKRQLQDTRAIAREQILRKALLGQTFSRVESAYIDQIVADGASNRYRIAVIQPILKPAVYEDFDENLSSNILYIIKSVIPPLFNFAKNWSVEMEHGRIFLFVDVDGAWNIERIREACQSVLQLFVQDSNYLSILIFLENVDVEFQDLAEYYKHVAKEFNTISPVGGSRIFSPDEESGSKHLVLTMENENKLVNMLSSGKKDEAIELLDQIVDACILAETSLVDIFNLVMQLYFAGAKSLAQQGLSLTPEENQSFSDFTANLQNKSSELIVTYLRTYLETVASRCAEMTAPLNMQLFKSYLDENFSQDISLDFLGEKYHTSPQYISRLIKKEVGMTYQNYLNHLRIEKAKDLLKTTNLPIMDVYEQVGYHSRNTFIRTFKAMCGVSPSEYRKIHLKEQ